MADLTLNSSEEALRVSFWLTSRSYDRRSTLPFHSPMTLSNCLAFLSMAALRTWAWSRLLVISLISEAILPLAFSTWFSLAFRLSMAASASVRRAASFILVISSSSPLATASVSYFWRQHWASPSALATSLRVFSRPADSSSRAQRAPSSSCSKFLYFPKSSPLSRASLSHRAFTSFSWAARADFCFAQMFRLLSRSPLTRLIVTQSLHIIQLGSEGGLLFCTDVQVVVKVPDDAEKVGVFAGNLVLGGCKVTESQVGIIDFLVDGVESLQHFLVGHIGRGLSPHHLICGSAGIGNLIHDQHLVLLDLALHLAKCVDLLSHLSGSIALLSLEVGKDRLLLDVGLFNVFSELVDLGLPLLVQFHLSSGGTAGFVQTLAQLVDLPRQIGPLPLGLCTSLALRLEFLLHGLNTALDLLDSLLGLGNQVLLIVQLGGELSVVLLFVTDGDLKIPLAALKLNDTILGHLQVSLNLPLLLLNSCP